MKPSETARFHPGGTFGETLVEFRFKCGIACGLLSLSTRELVDSRDTWRVCVGRRLCDLLRSALSLVNTD